MPNDFGLKQSPAPDPATLLVASCQLFQRRLGETMRRAGVREPAAIEAFEREIGDAHDELAAARPLDGFEQISGITASRLTLLGEDDLELDIRVREVGNRLREAGGRDLWRSQARYMALLARPTMNEADYPLGVEVICLGLRALCKHYGHQLELQLSLLQRIEEVLEQEVALVYREVDTLLANSGVELAPGRSPPTAARSTAERSLPRNTLSSANPLSTLQQAVRQQRQSTRDEPLDAGVDFLLEADDADCNPARGAVAMVMLQHLLERLSALEARSLATSDHAPAPKPELRALKAKDLDLPLGTPEAITLDTLALIFEAIFDTAAMPDAIKAAIARLQIPLVKLAMVDPSLFANNQHPARALINRISRAAIGLPRSAGREHPVCHRIDLLSTAVRAHLADRHAVLDAYLAELDELIDERDESIRQAGNAHLALVTEYEARQYAEELSRRWLRASLVRTRSPEVASFLEHYWFRVMVAAASEGGCEGKLWQEHSATGEDLIWSVLPKQTADERKRLAGMASSLVRRIGSGLEAIGVPPTERTPFLNTLFDLQTAALRNQSVASGAAPAIPEKTLSSSGQGTSKTGPRLLVRGEQRVHYLMLSTESATQRRSMTETWQVGEWLRFYAAEPEAVCGLCCWQNPAATSALFFNLDWGYAVVMSCSAIDQQLSTGRAEIVSRVAAFDAAAERALSLLAAR